MVTQTSADPLVLRPGTAVLRRDADTLQVGLEPPHVVHLPDLPEIRTLLQHLRRGHARARKSAQVDRALHLLLAAELAVPRGPASTDPAATVARAQFGADAERRLAQRRSMRVGLRAEEPARTLVEDLLLTAGLTVDDSAAAAFLTVGIGHVARESLDSFVRSGTPHLLLTGTATRRRVGPFVDPGRTACLRCVDAHESEADPRRPFLIEQAALTIPEPLPQDPLLDRIAAAWAVRDLCRYLEGDEPSTWSATADIGPGGLPVTRKWLRHPYCGCCWDQI